MKKSSNIPVTRPIAYPYGKLTEMIATTKDTKRHFFDGVISLMNDISERASNKRIMPSIGMGKNFTNSSNPLLKNKPMIKNSMP